MRRTRLPPISTRLARTLVAQVTEPEPLPPPPASPREAVPAVQTEVDVSQLLHIYSQLCDHAWIRDDENFQKTPHTDSFRYPIICVHAAPYTVYGPKR